MVVKRLFIYTTRFNEGIWKIEDHNRLIDRLNYILGTQECGANGGNGDYYTNGELYYNFDELPIVKKLYEEDSLGRTMLDIESGSFYLLYVSD